MERGGTPSRLGESVATIVLCVGRIREALAEGLSMLVCFRVSAEGLAEASGCAVDFIGVYGADARRSVLGSTRQPGHGVVREGIEIGEEIRFSLATESASSNRKPFVPEDEQIFFRLKSVA